MTTKFKPKRKDQVFTPLQNYYGAVSAFAHGGRFYLALGDVAGGGCIEIGEPLYLAFVSQFAPANCPFGDQDTDGYEVQGGAK